jgi:catalase
MAKRDRSRRILLGLCLVLAVVIGTFLLPLARSQDVQPSGREMVDAPHSAFGEHHARSVHAKGTIMTGSFAPSKEASRFTIAPHRKPSAGKVQVIARFSDFTGIPDIADTDLNGVQKASQCAFCYLTER